MANRRLTLWMALGLGACNPSAVKAGSDLSPGASPPDDELQVGSTCGTNEGSCTSPEPSGCYCCPQSGSTTYTALPSNNTYDITSFTDTHKDMGCAGAGLALQDGLAASTLQAMAQSGENLYIADAQRFGCGTHVRIDNPLNQTSCVAQVEDTGPNQCVELAAGSAVIDASPVILEHLFGYSSAGWSQRIAVVAQTTTDPVGCDDQVGKDTADGPQSTGTPTSPGGTPTVTGNPLDAGAGTGTTAVAQPACNLDGPTVAPPNGAACRNSLLAQCQENYQGNEVCCVADGLVPSGTYGAAACCAGNGLNGQACQPAAPIATGAFCGQNPTNCIPSDTGLRGDENTVVTATPTCQVRADGKQVCCIPNGEVVPGGSANAATNAELCCSYTGAGYLLDNGAACPGTPAGAAVSPCVEGVCPAAQQCQASAGYLSCK